MKVTYYPGCSLEGTARDYARSIHDVCETMGVELQEIPDWNCCGATAAHSVNHKASIELAGRNLKLASQMPNVDMLVPCPMCFNRLKTAVCALEDAGSHHYDVQIDAPIPEVWDIADYFASGPMLEKLAARVKKPLEGLNVVCYYGCMANRPPKITGATDHENPQSIDRIVKTLGANPIPWPYKTDCCGASLALSRPEMVTAFVGKLYDMAGRMGAQAIVVSCQMCQANLDMYQDRINAEWGRQVALPVLYFTELIGLACDLPGADKWLTAHFADPTPVLRESGLLAS